MLVTQTANTQVAVADCLLRVMVAGSEGQPCKRKYLSQSVYPLRTNHVTVHTIILKILMKEGVALVATSPLTMDA